MKQEEKISKFGKDYCLKHIHLVRDFCSRCVEALAKNDYNSADFYHNRAHRIVRGINPFCKYLAASDRKFIIEAKQRLEKYFAVNKFSFATADKHKIQSMMDEIMVETFELEKAVLGISLVQLS